MIDAIFGVVSVYFVNFAGDCCGAWLLVLCMTSLRFRLAWLCASVLGLGFAGLNACVAEGLQIY